MIKTGICKESLIICSEETQHSLTLCCKEISSLDLQRCREEEEEKEEEGKGRRSGRRERRGRRERKGRRGKLKLRELNFIINVQ